MDPLTGFMYSYQTYDQIPSNNYNTAYNIKPEPYNQNHHPPPYTGQTEPAQLKNNKDAETPVKENVKPTPKTEQPKLEHKQNNEQVDTKEPLKHLLPQKRKRGIKKGRTSSYWVKKIDDKTFPFFGCAICNVSYTDIKELDDHVKVHEGRLTSYDIRLHYQKMKKEKRKEEKRLKKLIKAGIVKEEDIKKEKKKMRIENTENFVDIDIKPEDGYIGNEKASEYNETAATNDQNGATNEQAMDKKVVTKYGETTDPRLHKLFKCYACHKQFSLCYYLKLHVRAHTNEKPYVCSMCGQSFITAGHLGRHNKRVHLAIKFQCRVCFKSFVRFDNLQRHFDKKHLDQKLEGEPYDYNAILPYLQELQEQNILEKEMKPIKDDNLLDAKPENDQKNKLMDVDKSKSPDLKDGDRESDSLNSERIDSLNSERIVGSKDSGHFIFGDNQCSNDSQCPYNAKCESQSHCLCNDYDIFTDNTYTYIFKQEESCDGPDFPKQFVTVQIEEVQPDSKEMEEVLPLNPVVKVEVADTKYPAEYLDETEDFLQSGNDNPSDEDYFPENTWVDEPKVKIESGKKTAPKEKSSEKTTAKEKSYCETCDRSFTTTYYKIHMRTHTGEKPFNCVICGVGFVSSSKLQAHVVTHKNWQEKVGDVESKDVKLESEEQSKEIQSPDVKKEGASASAPVKREKKKKKNKKNKRKGEGRLSKGYKRDVRCIFCYKTFLYEDALLVHRATHKDDATPLPCFYCSAVYPTEQTLKEHQSIHSENPRFLCTICEKRYFKKDALIAHRKTVHNETTLTKKINRPTLRGRPKAQFICDICSKACHTLKSLQKHIVGHAVQKFTLRYECPVCAHMFHTKYHVQMHLSTHQKEGLILEENRADILAMVMQNARKIPKKVEEANISDLFPPDDRSRVCNICGQVFQHFFYLEEHLKTHGSKIAIEDNEKVDERKHICKICNKGFKLPYYLKLHSFTHVKERPYICQQCGKGFITKGKLKRHLETHSGLKKYQCHVCYKFFTRPAYLRIHVRTIHGTQDFSSFRLGGSKMSGEDSV